jgi:hypothetical protein
MAEILQMPCSLQIARLPAWVGFRQNTTSQITPCRPGESAAVIAEQVRCCPGRFLPTKHSVIPAKAGIQRLGGTKRHWTPASAGVTKHCLTRVGLNELIPS